ncbi:GMC oxidoreductase [Sinomonas sp. G460-2]|uniref:GMC oxidoreductase n=1 Tax=Sinomonas sp. G460-2 TaxID=3393464 RepID=UPI0039F091E1
MPHGRPQWSQYLLGLGYPEGESALDCASLSDSAYQVQARNAVEDAVAGYTATDASVAVQYIGATALSIPAGFFSTADLLLEDFMADDLGLNRARPTINLNFAVWSVLTDQNNPQQVVGVQGWDLLSQVQRTFRAKKVVLAAGTIESAKIALQSQLHDPNGKIGRGLTDHTIRYRHFTLPPGSELTSPGDSAKILLRHPQAAPGQHAFDIVVELGSEFNQGRYIDPEHLAQERAERGDWMMCELVFMSYADLNEDNYLTAAGAPGDPVTVMVNRTLPSARDLAEADQLAGAFFNKFGAEPVLGENGLGLLDADLGGVAHEVGTLRMAGDGTGIVDADLKFLDYDNLFACDNSVFPTSPAANPSLTLAALALRLADHLM